MNVWAQEKKIEQACTRIRRVENRLFTRLETELDILMDEPDSISYCYELVFAEPFEGHTDPQRAQFLLSWIWFDYRAFDTEDKPDEPITLADLMVRPAARKEFGFSAEDVQFLLAGRNSRLSWYLVEGVREGISLDLRDLFTNQVITVREHSASQPELKGVVLLARVMSLWGASVMMGSYPQLIDQRFFNRALSERDVLSESFKDLPNNASGAIRRECAIRLQYINLLEELAELLQQPPAMVNQDGDPFVAIEVKWQLTKPLREIEGVFARVPALLPASLRIKRTKSGDIKNIEAGLGRPPEEKHKVQKTGDEERATVVFAFLIASKEKLVAQVNSHERAEEVVSLIEGHFGELVCGRKLSKQRRAKKRQSNKRSEEVEECSFSQQELSSMPDVREAMQTMMAKHWDSWCDTKIPALDDVTPRQAVKSERGRELLEGLFRFYELNIEKTPPDERWLCPDVQALRAQLGLALDA